MSDLPEMFINRIFNLNSKQLKRRINAVKKRLAYMEEQLIKKNE